MGKGRSADRAPDTSLAAPVNNKAEDRVKWFNPVVIALVGIAVIAGRSLDAQVTPASAVAPVAAPAPGYHTIRNDFFVVDQHGDRINTRSGCLRQFNGLFYWYGGTNRFHDQTCYVSNDLVHWIYKGVVLHLDLDADRMDVLFNAATK